jgi:hypothetical protein
MKTPVITKGWPPERRRAQAARLKAQKPWLHSTGPRTTEGKARSRLNGYRHGLRSAAMRRLKSLMREQRRFVRDFVVGKPAPAPHMDSSHPPRYFIAATRETCHGTGGAQKG